jgi:hypothetical protein
MHRCPLPSLVTAVCTQETWNIHWLAKHCACLEVWCCQGRVCWNIRPLVGTLGGKLLQDCPNLEMRNVLRNVGSCLPNYRTSGLVKQYSTFVVGLFIHTYVFLPDFRLALQCFRGFRSSNLFRFVTERIYPDVSRECAAFTFKN